MTAAELRAWRAAHRLTQAALAQRLGVAEYTVQRWERGQVAPPAYLGLALERLDQLLTAA